MSGIEQEPQQPERPDWLLDKFKSVDDQARSYSEAEQRLVALQAQLDQEREQFSSALQNMESMREQELATQQQQSWDPNANPLIQNFQRALDEGDAQALLAMQLELNRQVMRQEMQSAMQEFGGKVDRNQDAEREMAITMATERVARQYEDWDALAPRIGAFLQQRPHWIPESSSVEGFERALNEAASVILAQDTMERRTAEENDRVAKLNQAGGLVGLGAQAPRSPEQDAQEWARIKDSRLGGYADLFKK